MAKIVIITGATATGKTDISIQLAKIIDGEIISADSMMVYKYMDIGTAKPSLEERQNIPHYLIDIKEPNEIFSAKEFIELADRHIKKIQKKGKVPIVVGGTWLYIQALLYGLSKAPKANWSLRRELYRFSTEELFERLVKIDQSYAKKIHKNDKKRIIRALEVFYLTGKPFSNFIKEHSFKNRRYDFIGFNITREKKEIENRIEKRVFNMIQKGLVEELKNLIDMGYKKAITSSQAIGYKELLPYLEKKQSLEESIQDIIKNTKLFAKRQIKTLKKKEDLIPINLTDRGSQEALQGIVKTIQKEVRT
ncbi:MAG: tRNA (adenosine(37)-N6)-dimethylallyltransferase MiaA [Aquificae bacterium]|nr:tRNA (adenosine(37)-N6)-dimethylallyltransferase MiaA [Aquificota bacterium]